MASYRYAAFLRGINVGGNNVIRMVDVRKALEEAACRDVKTVLASGNVVFTSEDADAATARERVESALEGLAGRRIAVLARSMMQIQSLVSRDPFAGVEVTPETRLYVTFLPEGATSGLAMPYRTPRGELTLLERTESELISVLQLLDGSRSVDAMALIEKEFGSGVTTRSWNTVVKVAAAGK